MPLYPLTMSEGDIASRQDGELMTIPKLEVQIVAQLAPLPESTPVELPSPDRPCAYDPATGDFRYLDSRARHILLLISTLWELSARPCSNQAHLGFPGPPNYKSKVGSGYHPRAVATAHNSPAMRQTSRSQF